MALLCLTVAGSGAGATSRVQTLHMMKFVKRSDRDTGRFETEAEASVNISVVNHIPTQAAPAQIAIPRY